MTAVEYKTEFSIWAISASPLVVTTPIMNCSAVDSCVPWISDLQREILFNEDVIAVNQDVTPQGRPVHDGDLTVWTRTLTGGDVAVALYNENDASMKIGFDLNTIKIDPDSKPCVRDLWAHEDATDDLHDDGTFGPIDVEAHETKMYRVGSSVCA